MSSTLKKQIVSGFGWQSGITVVQAIVTMVVFAVMARYLDRQDFGIVAIANILIAFLEKFLAAGAGAAIVQKLDIDDPTLSAAFWLSLVTGTILAVLTYLLAAPFSLFMDADLAEPILKVLSVSFIIIAISSVPARILQRQFDFRYLFFVKFSASVFGYGLCGIYAAINGFGAWAIVISTMSMNLIVLIGYLLKVRTKWNTKGIKDSLRWLLDFAAGMSVMAILNFFSQQIDRIVVGKRFDVVDLGRYVVPLQLALLPTRYVGDIMQNVMFPALSRVQTEPGKVKRLFLASIFISLILIMPCALIFVFHSELVIRVLFGIKWLDTSPLLRIMAVGVVARAVIRMVDTLAHSQKKLYLNSLVNGASAVSLLVASGIGSFWGIEGVAIGVQIGLIACLAYSYRLMQHITGLQFRDFSEVLRPVIIFAIAFTVLSLVGDVITPSNGDWILQIVEVATVSTLSALITLFACRALLAIYIDLYGDVFRRENQ